MRKAGVYTLFALLAMSVAAAQQDATAPYGEQEPTAAVAGEQQTLRGCLVRQDGEFTLTDQEGKRYRVEGEEQLLAEHENHLVELSGKLTEQQRPEGVADPEGEQIAGTMRAEGLQHVEPACPTNETGAALQEDAATDQAMTEEPATDTLATETRPATEQDEAAVAFQDDPAVAREEDDTTVAQDVEQGAREVGQATEEAGAAIVQETEEAGEAIGQEFGRDADTAVQSDEQREVARIDDQEMALPETASPLPLLLLLGFGSLVAGWFVRRK